MRAPAQRSFEEAVPIAVGVAATADHQIRPTSHTLPQHLAVPKEARPAVPDLDVEAYQTLAEAAQAYQTKLSVIANNLANAETTAFKRGRVILEDLPYRHERMPGTEDTAGQYAAAGIGVGTGARVAAVQTDFSQGAFHQTGQELDVTIQGDGFFQVTNPSGDTLYIRAGNFSKDANGQIVTPSAGTGRLLNPPITIPEDATDVVISPEGIVSVRQPGSSNLSQVGQIELARFVNPQGLLRLGENLFAETDSSGPPILGQPGRSGIGSLRQGTLEASNVQPDQERVEWKRTAARLQTIRQLLQVE